MPVFLGITVFLGIIIGQTINDIQLKLCYLLILFLFFITITNIYISTHYYRKLREDPGIKGPRGDPGDVGPKGSDGVCSLSTSCNINDCKSFIEKIFLEMEKYPGTEYRTLKEKMSNNVILNQNEKKKLQQIDDWINLLTNICKKQLYNKSELQKFIEDSFKTGSLVLPNN